MESQNQVNLSVSMLDNVFEDGQKEELRKELKDMSICPFCGKKLNRPMDQHLMQEHEEMSATSILDQIDKKMQDFASISSDIFFFKFAFDVKAKVKKPTPEETLKYRNIKEEVTRISTGALCDLV